MIGSVFKPIILISLITKLVFKITNLIILFIHAIFKNPFLVSINTIHIVIIANLVSKEVVGVIELVFYKI